MRLVVLEVRLGDRDVRNELGEQFEYEVEHGRELGRDEVLHLALGAD